MQGKDPQLFYEAHRSGNKWMLLTQVNWFNLLCGGVEGSL